MNQFQRVYSCTAWAATASCGVTVGQTPDPIPQFRDWIRELGSSISENAPTVASLKNLLAELLVDRR